MSTILKLEHLTKRFGGLCAVNDLSLEMHVQLLFAASAGMIVPALATQPPGHAMPSSKNPSSFPSFASVRSRLHSRSPSAR